MTKEELKEKKEELIDKLKDLDERMESLSVEIDTIRLDDVDMEVHVFHRDIDSSLFQAEDKIQESLYFINEAIDQIKP